MVWIKVQAIVQPASTSVESGLDLFLRLGVIVASKPVKPAISIPEHIDLLRNRGMEVDAELAQQWLQYGVIGQNVLVLW